MRHPKQWGFLYPSKPEIFQHFIFKIFPPQAGKSTETGLTGVNESISTASVNKSRDWHISMGVICKQSKAC